jgi:4-hydroxy-tetrahydrodipicolinate synthase
MKTVNLEGIIATTVTPFLPNEDIDEQAFVEQIRYFLNVGVDGISVGGSTGEGAVLTDDELYRLCELAVSEVNGRVPVVAGVIRNSTRAAVHGALRAKKAGVDALMVTPVHYHVNKPSASGNVDFYRRIGDAAELPIIVYNVVPSNTITPEVMDELLAIPQVVAIKQSVGGMSALAQMVAAHGDRLLISSAVDDLLYPTYMIGARGSIVAPSAVVPELLVEQWQAFRKGDHETALRIHDRLMYVYRALQGENFQGRIKEAARMLGRNPGVTRSPVQMPTEEEKAFIRQMLVKAEVLTS